MKLKFLAKGQPQPDYSISNSNVNGVNLSVFPEGGKFVGNEQTRAAGIYNVEHDGELVVTLGQHGLAYECCPVNGSHDWRESDLIDASDYIHGTCYIKAISKPDGSYIQVRENGFTVCGETEDE